MIQRFEDMGRQAACIWLHRAGRAPATHLTIEATLVSHDLRPDLYGESPWFYLNLPRGETAIIDRDNKPLTDGYKWHRGGPLGYVTAHAIDGGRNVKVYLHRLVLNAPVGLTVDHINGDVLDNRRQNLRLGTQQQNTFNQRGSRNNKSGAKGVSRRTDNGKWRARIMVNGKEIGLGCFDTQDDAARAYNEAAAEYFGEFAWLNEIHQNSDIIEAL